MERPICLASRAPPRNPTRPLMSANSVASAKNNAETGKSPAPSAFINPISLLRSKIAVAIAADTANAEANRAATVISSINPFMRERTVNRPLTLNPPPGMRYPKSGHEVLFPELNLLGKIGSEQGGIRASKVHANRQHRSEPHDVIAPKHAFDLRQIGFVEISAVAGRLQIHAAEFHVESIFLRRDG